LEGVNFAQPIVVVHVHLFICERLFLNILLMASLLRRYFTCVLNHAGGVVGKEARDGVPESWLGDTRSSRELVGTPLGQLLAEGLVKQLSTHGVLVELVDVEDSVLVELGKRVCLGPEGGWLDYSGLEGATVFLLLLPRVLGQLRLTFGFLKLHLNKYYTYETYTTI
jgi:hypothetical protein